MRIDIVENVNTTLQYLLAAHFYEKRHHHVARYGVGEGEEVDGLGVVIHARVDAKVHRAADDRGPDCLHNEEVPEVARCEAVSGRAQPRFGGGFPDGHGRT